MMSVFVSSLAWRLGGLSFVCASLAACSTIVTGTHQQVAISTPGTENASCHLTGGDGVDLTVATPGTARLPKSKKDITVACEAPGQRSASATLKSTYSNWSIIQDPLGYPVDAISGAMWSYPKIFAVPVGGGAQKTSPPVAMPARSIGA